MDAVAEGPAAYVVERSFARRLVAAFCFSICGIRGYGLQYPFMISARQCYLFDQFVPVHHATSLQREEMLILSRMRSAALPRRNGGRLVR